MTPSSLIAALFPKEYESAVKAYSLQVWDPPLPFGVRFDRNPPAFFKYFPTLDHLALYDLVQCVLVFNAKMTADAKPPEPDQCLAALTDRQRIERLERLVCALASGLLSHEYSKDLCLDGIERCCLKLANDQDLQGALLELAV